MKKLLLLTILCGAWISASAENAKRVDAQSITDDGCKGSPSYSAAAPSLEPDTPTTPAWEIKYEEGVLSVTWLNFIANCCPEGFNSWIEVKEDANLEFQCYSNDGLCDCLCVYDVTATYAGVAPGRYTLTFTSYYGKHSVELDLSEGCHKTLEATAGMRAETVENGGITVSPEGLLRVATTGKSVVEVYDMSGALKSRVEVRNGQPVDLSGLRAGIYVAKAKVGDRTATVRFVR